MLRRPSELKLTFIIKQNTDFGTLTQIVLSDTIKIEVKQKHSNIWLLYLVWRSN